MISNRLTNYVNELRVEDQKIETELEKFIYTYIYIDELVIYLNYYISTPPL